MIKILLLWQTERVIIQYMIPLLWFARFFSSFDIMLTGTLKETEWALKLELEQAEWKHTKRHKETDLKKKWRHGEGEGEGVWQRKETRRTVRRRRGRRHKKDSWRNNICSRLHVSAQLVRGFCERCIFIAYKNFMNTKECHRRSRCTISWRSGKRMLVIIGKGGGSLDAAVTN